MKIRVLISLIFANTIVAQSAYCVPREAPHARVIEPRKRERAASLTPSQQDVRSGFQLSTGVGLRFIVPQLRLGVETGSKKSVFAGLIFEGFALQEPTQRHWSSIAQLNLRAGRSVMWHWLTTRTYFEFGGGYVKVGGGGFSTTFFTIGVGLALLRWTGAWFGGVDLSLRGYALGRYFLPLPGAMLVIGRHFE